MSPLERRGDEKVYWTADVAIGEGRFYDDHFTIRLALHEETERYHGRSEIFPLTSKTGSRVYFHAQPYILIPDIRLAVGLYSHPRGEAIGEVESSSWEGMRHEVVGNAQAWYYPAEKALLMWEAFLEERHRRADPLDDENLQTLWTGLERVLLDRCAGVERFYTTWEDIYERSLWKQFVEDCGYRQIAPALFQKDAAGVDCERL
jgi:hypothetical protein